MFHVEHCGRITTHHQHQKPTSLSPLGGKEGSLGDGTGSSGPRFGANCCNKFVKKNCASGARRLVRLSAPNFSPVRTFLKDQIGRDQLSLLCCGTMMVLAP